MSDKNIFLKALEKSAGLEWPSLRFFLEKIPAALIAGSSVAGASLLWFWAFTAQSSASIADLALIALIATYWVSFEYLFEDETGTFIPAALVWAASGILGMSAALFSAPLVYVAGIVGGLAIGGCIYAAVFSIAQWAASKTASWFLRWVVARVSQSGAART